MGQADTKMGGSRDDFPETAWSFIVSNPDSPKRADKLNHLLSRYWRPVYKYIRAAWSKSVEDAKDLAQEFFFRLMEGDVVATYDPNRGRFRHFLKGVLKNFLARDYRDGRTLKRGGGKPVFSLDVEELETEKFLAETRELSPEEIFDRQWAREVLEQAAGRLKTELEKQGKQAHFEIYEAYTNPATGSRPTYKDVAKTFGVSTTDVDNRIRFVRTRLNELIVESISDYVISQEAVMEELKELF